MNHCSLLSRILFLSSLVLICTNSCKDQEAEELILIDFENEFDPERVDSKDASFEIVQVGGDHLLRVATDFVFSAPGVTLHEPEDRLWDLSEYSQVQATVSNVGDEAMQVQLFVGNDPDARVRRQCSNYVDLNPGETKTLTVALSWTPWVFDPQIEIVGMRGVPGRIKMDLSSIKELTFCSRYPAAANEFTIDNVRASRKFEIREKAGFFPFIDEFGQYIHREWKGKIHSTEELVESGAIERNRLVENPGPKQRGKYGGWTGGPQLKKTGFFRAEKYNEKWWMVDPEGHLFWSTGMNCVSSDSVTTGIQYREHYFRNLPEKNSGLGQFYGESNWAPHGFYEDKKPFEIFNFYQSNLYRKYEDQWLDEFRNLVHQRFRSWGMNTIGFVSDRELLKQQKTPYVGSVWIRGTKKIEASKAYWGKFPDVFDSGFRLAVRRSMEEQKTGAGDPWCIGFYVDNELSWGQLGSISLDVLESPSTQPAKKELVRDLKGKYQDIGSLNRTWGTTHESWDALLITTRAPDAEKAMDDLASFYEKIAVTYFKTVKEELDRIAPDQYYFGCRFAWSNNDVTLRSAGRYCDVLSFNKYEYSVANLKLPMSVDKPVIIGEFHFGALDRGSFHTGLKEAGNQAERGECYKNYVEGALGNPLIVGAHWFQYIDEPTTGRGDGENYNIGFVDVCDNPYDDLIDEVREINYQMYDYRLNY